jgi:hypothetical protein
MTIPLRTGEIGHGCTWGWYSGLFRDALGVVATGAELLADLTDRIFDNPDWAGKSPNSAGTGRSRQLFRSSTAA